MARFKTVTPRTQLILDAILFALFVTVLVSALMVEVILPDVPVSSLTMQSVDGSASPVESVGAQTVPASVLTWHRIHGWAGVLLTAVVGIHLFLHLSWVDCQIRRLVKRPAARAKGQFAHRRPVDAVPGSSHADSHGDQP